MVHAAGIRDDGVSFVILGPAVTAICAETLRYLSFRAGRSMCANRTLGGALMVGLGYGGMNAIFEWVISMVRYGAPHGPWVFVLGFVVGFVVACALVLIIELVRRCLGPPSGVAEWGSWYCDGTRRS